MATAKQESGASKFSIVREIAKLLKLGDQGKLDSFLTRVVKMLGRDIAALKKNLGTLEFSHTQEIDELEDKLEDAKDSLENAYLQIDVTRITTNEDQTRYADEYLENINNAKSKVISIEKSIELKKETFERASKEINDKITSFQERVDRISLN